MMSFTTERPTTMRAWTHTSHGRPTSVLKLSTIPFSPSLSPDEILISISHCALNPGASLITTVIPMLFRTSPQVPDMDFSGSIIRLGSSVPESRALKPGTKVFGSVPVGEHVKGGKGALAEFVIVPHWAVCGVPGSMHMEEAAGLGIAGRAALGLVQKAGLKQGAHLLINGASGGVGTFVVQIARSVIQESGKIVAICSERNITVVKDRGADEVVNYHLFAPVQRHLAETYKAERFDAIIDCYGSQDLWLSCSDYLKPGMPFVTFGVAPLTSTFASFVGAMCQTLSNVLWPRFLGGVDRPYTFVSAGAANPGDLEKLAEMVKDGKLKVVIDSSWKFENALKAYERILSRHASGKVIVQVSEEQGGNDLTTSPGTGISKKCGFSEAAGVL